MKRTHLILILGAAVLVGAVAATAAPAAAQAGDPVSFYGTVADGDGDPAPEGTTIVAVVDGEVRGELDVGDDGTLGGPDLTDDKIVVRSDAGDEVAFHIESPDGPQAEETFDLDPGIVEVDLTFPDGFSFEPAVDVTAPSAVETGEAVEIDVTAENVGAVSGSESFTVEVDGETELDETLELDSGASDTRTIEITAPDEETTIEIDADYGAASATAEIDVEAEVEDDDDDGNGGAGGGGQGGGGAPAPPAPDPDPESDDPAPGEPERTVLEDPDTIAEQVALPAGSTASYAEIVELTVEPDADRSLATFTDEAGVASVTIAGTVDGEITATDLADMPDATDSLDATVATATQLTVPDDATTRAATLQFRVSQERIAELDATPDELTIIRHDAAADTWEPLDTAVVSDSDADPVVVQAQTPGFSTFAVGVLDEAATDEEADEEPTTDDADEETTDDDATGEEADEEPADADGAVVDDTDDEIPGFTGALAVLALLVTLIGLRRVASQP